MAIVYLKEYQQIPLTNGGYGPLTALRILRIIASESGLTKSCWRVTSSLVTRLIDTGHLLSANRSKYWTSSSGGYIGAGHFPFNGCDGLHTPSIVMSKYACNPS